jgi:hypothetical protein
MSNRSKATSQKSGLSRYRVMQMEKQKRIFRADKFKKRKADPNSVMYQYYEETFKISKITDIRAFLRTCSEYWGLEPISKYSFYDDNGEKINYSWNDDKMLDPTLGKIRTIEKIIENAMVKDFLNKDLFPNEPRRYLLYLGDDKFEETYKDWIDAKRHLYDIEK